MLTMSLSSDYRLIIKEESVVTTNVEISRYNKGPETPQDAIQRNFNGPLKNQPKVRKYRALSGKSWKLPISFIFLYIGSF